MVKVKHLMDRIEIGDGERVWVEPVGLAKDLRAWCAVDHVGTEFAPPLEFWERFEEHPEKYDEFRSAYHRGLAQHPDGARLLALAVFGSASNLTLLHQGEDRERNTAAALSEFLRSLVANCPPEE